MATSTGNSYQSPHFAVGFPSFSRLLQANWFNLFVLGLLVYLLFEKDITIRLQLQERGWMNIQMPFSQDPGAAGLAIPTTGRHSARTQKKVWRPSDFSNLTFVLDPSYADRKNVPQDIVAAKIANCIDYVRKYMAEAREEMQKFGIPASITLAQGLLESNAGDSRLARESNNHFGIKCRAKCRGCTCRNYTDDDIYDMFRVFNKPLESFEEHSKLLTSSRYRHLLKLKSGNYRSWAHGLKKAGYATDKRYAEKLIQIIEFFKLYRFDS